MNSYFSRLLKPPTRKCWHLSWHSNGRCTICVWFTYGGYRLGYPGFEHQGVEPGDDCQLTVNLSISRLTLNIFSPTVWNFFVNFLRQHDFSTNRLSIFRSGFSDSIWSQNLQNSDCRQVHSLYGHGGTVIALDYGLDLLLRRSCAAVVWEWSAGKHQKPWRLTVKASWIQPCLIKHEKH